MIGDGNFSNKTPFKQFEANYIVANGAYDLSLVLNSFSLIIISVIGSYTFYQRRMINSVQRVHSPNLLSASAVSLREFGERNCSRELAIKPVRKKRDEHLQKRN